MRGGPPTPRRRRWLRRIFTTGVLVVLLTAGYAGAMQASLQNDASLTSREARDQLHAAVHGGALSIAFAVGWLVGWFEERNGFAYAITVTVVLAFLMVFALVLSRELACSGGVIVLRHWTCS